MEKNCPKCEREQVYTYNPKACQFIEDFGKKSGYNFQHAMNGGEIIISVYSLDGYYKEKNVVFEYDEPKQQNNKLYEVISRKEIL